MMRSVDGAGAGIIIALPFLASVDNVALRALAHIIIPQNAKGSILPLKRLDPLER